jgi:hypothetical protein
MRHLTRTLVAFLMTATALAQEVVFDSLIDPITDQNTSLLAIRTTDYDSWNVDHGDLVISCAGEDV